MPQRRLNSLQIEVETFADIPVTFAIPRPANFPSFGNHPKQLPAIIREVALTESAIFPDQFRPLIWPDHAQVITPFRSALNDYIHDGNTPLSRSVSSWRIQSLCHSSSSGVFASTAASALRLAN